jgi:aspartyl-tRNA(Asn)/glutamyl-tRNA(Gln) amidotransferase subunit A
MAVGTDGGGSIRCPSSCAGIVGIKPTLGRVPREFFGDACFNYAAAGPITRTVGDLRLMLAVMSGPFTDDLHTLEVDPMPLPEAPPEGGVSGLRIAWIERFGAIPLDEEVAALPGAAVQAMEGAGARVEAVDGSIFADAFEYYVVIATTAHAGRLTAVLEKWGDKITPSMQASIRQGGTYSAADLVRAGDRRTALYRSVQAMFHDYDLIVTPTHNAPPKTVDENCAINSQMYAERAGYLYPFNLSSNPAASVPVGFTTSGLPVGLQVVGPWYGEPQMLSAMAWVEAAMPWGAKRPTL